MSSEGSRLCLMLACALGILGGCATVPPAPKNAQNGPPAESNEHDGWLFKSLTGQQAPAKPAASATPDAANPATAAGAPSAVTPASYTAAASPESEELAAVDPAGQFLGVLIPSAPGRWRPLRNLPTDS